jgi:prephenate dehydrogenase
MPEDIEKPVSAVLRNGAESINLQITIVGLGLMGGSLARALRPYINHITAVDPNPTTLAAALEAGVIDRGTAVLQEGLAGAELVILAAPVRTILDILSQLPALCPEGCLVLDLGSTKGEVGAAMDQLPASFQAIGGHPMCGKESSGFAQADPALFQDKTFVLCRGRRTAETVERLALKIVEMIGSRPLFLPPALHDELVSITSHLPYLISAVLMQLAAAKADEAADLWPVSASGFRDTSRLAGSSPVVMGDILLTNRRAVLRQIGRYRQRLDDLFNLLEQEDEQRLMEWLEMAWEEHERFKEIMN